MTNVRTRCAACDRPASVVDHACACGGQLTLDYELGELAGWRPTGGGLSRYLPLLPVNALPAEMGEGGTPLIESRSIGPALGVRLFFKLESLNPTGSYKDRIASVGAALARSSGRTAVIATSSGNAGASIAAYAARAGLRAVLLVPEEAPPAKLAQIRAYGAVLVIVRGVLAARDGAARMFESVMRTSAATGWLPMITAHRFAPAAMEGVKTLAHEIVESLGTAPDHVYVPVGGGGLLAATWRGFVEARALGWTERAPRMVAVQPEGCAPVVDAATGRPARPGGPTTRVSGLQVAAPPDADLVLRALQDSKGAALEIADSETYSAQRRLAAEEAVYAEPAGAIALAGLLRDVEAGRLRCGEVTVCLVTGTGFKDPEPLAASAPSPTLTLDELHRLPEITAGLVAS